MVAHRSFIVSLGLVSVLALASVSRAQVILGGSAADNVATAASRSPGHMVGAGMGRAAAFRDRSRAVPNITETDPGDLLPRQTFLVSAFQTIFEQLNLAIVGFHNLILARAGEPPIIPASVFPAVADLMANDGADAGGTLDDFDLAGLFAQFGGPPDDGQQPDGPRPNETY